MIVDRISNLELYRGLHPRWVKALEFLRDNDGTSLSLGRHDLDGDRLFALVQEYSTKEPDQCRWEAHQRYCDVQFMVQGSERIEITHVEELTVEEPYDADKDIAFFSGPQGDVITLRSGVFAIFAPHDAHKPAICVGRPEQARKIIIKAAV